MAFLIGRMCGRYGLDEDDAKEAYSSSIFALYQTIRSGTFRGESKLSTYLTKIFSNRCIDILRKNSSSKVERPETLPDLHDESKDIIKEITIGEDFNKAKTWMDQLGALCKQIILDALYWHYTMEEIAERNALKDARHASDRKYECLQRLRRMMNS